MARQVFYSFHFQPDNWRVSTIRNIGVIEGNRPATDNDWHTIVNRGEQAIRNWIDEQMRSRSTTIVLVGSQTAGRKWVNYEIEKSWNNKMAVLGINIHNIKDRFGNNSYQGVNPFSLIRLNNLDMGQIIPIYNPPYYDSKDTYNYIANNISNWIEEAHKIRAKY
ncbi:MAG: TIR domain-containing protein [Chitinophagaceae bacterium]|nr:TIR domain-containing protein [Chitinophagaceae bacterium]